MSGNRINTNALTPNARFMIRGKTSYSHVTSLIDGEELERDIQRRQKRGQTPVEKPYVTISIHSAHVIYANPAAANDPVQKRPEELYAEGRLYKSSNPKNQGMCFSIDSKGKRLPWIGTAQADGKTVVQLNNVEGELASGLDVTLVLRVYQAARNNGVALEGVIVNEPIRYFNNGSTDLSAYGLNFVAAEPAPVPAAEKLAAVPPVPETDEPFSAPEAPEAPANAEPVPPVPACGIAYDPNDDPQRQY